MVDKIWIIFVEWLVWTCCQCWLTSHASAWWCWSSHLHRCDASAPPSISVSGWSAVIQHAISCMLGCCFTFRSGWQLAAANRAFQSPASAELFCSIFEWGRWCCTITTFIETTVYLNLIFCGLKKWRDGLWHICCQERCCASVAGVMLRFSIDLPIHCSLDSSR